MSNENENKRIDLTGFEGFTRDEWSQNGWHIGPNLIAELERCYEEVDYYKCLLNELYSSKQISPSDVLAIEQEVKREFYPELFHHGDGWEKSGGPCECMKCQEEEASE